MKKHLYITVYHQYRAYGGPEEGGWWYDWTEVDCHLLVGRDKRHKLPRLLREARAYADSMNDGLPYYSVNSNGRYVVVVESTLGSLASKERPCYC
jgi:hypothetical protein